MKKLLLLLLFLPGLLHGQAVDTSTTQKKLNYWLKVIASNRINNMPDRTLSNTVRALGNLIGERGPVISIADLRAGKADTSSVVYIRDKGKEGQFIYRPGDTRLDDSVIVIRVGNKRFERVYDGIANPSWWGINGDGSTEQSALWTKAVNNINVRHIHFPKPKVSYRISKIAITGSNKTLTFEDGTIIEGTGVLTINDHLVSIVNAKNITIKGTNVTFRNNRNVYAADQTRGVFKIMSSTNVRIEGITARYSPGDGFYIGTQTFGVPSKDITISNCVVDSCVRNGMSVISVDGLLVENCLFQNSNGAAPEAGIDLEPNNAIESMRNIRIINTITKNNNGAGILVVPYKLKNQGREIDVWIDNHYSDNDTYAAMVGQNDGAVDGKVTWNNPVWKNSKQRAFLAFNWSVRSPRVEVIGAEVFNCGRQEFYGSKAVFDVYRRFEGGTDKIGNVHFIRPRVVDSRTIGAETNPAYDGNTFRFLDDQAVGPVENCSVIDPLEIRGISSLDLTMYDRNASLIISDKYGVLGRSITENTTITPWRVKPKFTNEGAINPVIITLPNLPQLTFNKEVEFEVVAPQLLRVDLGANQTIIPSSMSGTYIESSTPRSRIKIKRAGNFSWQIIEMVGDWRDGSGAVLATPTVATLNNSDVPASANLDNYTSAGIYNIGLNNTAVTLLNSPTIRAGVLEVRNTKYAIYQTYREFFNGPIYERSSQAMTLVGAKWYRLSKGITEVASIDLPNVPANSTVNVNINVEGVVLGQAVTGIALNRSLLGLLPLRGVVEGPNMVKISITNPTNAAINVEPGEVRLRIESL